MTEDTEAQVDYYSKQNNNVAYKKRMAIADESVYL